MAGGTDKPLAEFEWDEDNHGDPTTFHCDVYANRLDWYGESHHPLWKGWFDIGRQIPLDFLSSGPPPGVKLPEKQRLKIIRFLEKTNFGSKL